jgi:hypothetical protein
VDPKVIYWVKCSADMGGEAVAIPNYGKYQLYKPVDETGLFLNFAELPATKEAITAFVMRYGLLGLSSLRELGLSSDVPMSGSRVPAESIRSWALLIEWMSYYTQLWNALRREDKGALGAFCAWSGDKYEFLSEPAYQFRHAGGETGPRGDDWVSALVRGHVDPGDVLGLAGVQLQEGASSALRALAFSNLVLAWSPDGNRFQLLPSFPNITLLLVMVLQFAVAVAEEQQFQQCPMCGKWFRLEPGVNKADRVFCSLSCRKKAYYRRKLKAVELHAGGKGVKEIAKELGSTVETIKGWLAEQREK